MEQALIYMVVMGFNTSIPCGLIYSDYLSLLEILLGKTLVNFHRMYYLADIIKNNDVFCTEHNIPYHLFVTR